MIRPFGVCAVTALMGCVAVALASACGAGDVHAVTTASHAASDAGATPTELPAAPPQYVLGDTAGRAIAPMALDRADVLGTIQDGLRVVSTGGGVRSAREITEPALVAAERVPRWLGGGFLLRSTTAIYLADAFDGALRPVVTLPSPIERVAFGPKFALVRASNGERWAIDLAQAKRVAVTPMGLVDVAAVEGRAAALTDAGGALVSTDGGEKWSDVSAQLRGRPERVAVLEDAVWIVEAGGAALRVDGDRLSSFDRAPAPKPVELRPRDPRWHAEEPPIRRAIRLGTPLDDHTALVASEGDVVRVNVTTGEIVSAIQGRLPPDATCEALRTQDEVVLVCTRPTGGAFVASHVGGDKTLTIEQTFAAPGQFFASDDGALAFGGPCARPKASHLIVCVRGPGAAWQEYDLEPFLADAGAGADVARWIPRTDGGAIGFLVGAQPSIVDARSGEAHAWHMDAIPAAARTAITDARRSAHGPHVIDRTWSASPAGGLRGWTDGGAAIDVSPEGAVVLSPFAFDRVATAGAFAFARGREGRVWQSLDRGASWAEVAPPPTAAGARGQPDPRACSAVGCDLGTWYRVGWAQIPPVVAPPPTVAGPPARLVRSAAPSLTCKRAGETKTQGVPRFDASPEDLGLGAARVSVSNDGGTIEFVRTALGRLALNPPHGGTDARDTDYGAARALVHGPQTEAAGEDRFVVLAPNKDPNALRRSIAFVAPFNPTGAVRRTQLGTLDVLGAARAGGLRSADVLREDMTSLGLVTLATPLDPAAPADLVASSALGVLAVLRAGPTPRGRIALRVQSSDDAIPVSAAQLSADEMAILELETSGRGVVYKVGASGISNLFDVPAPPRAGFYPANVDAVALGPKNEVATLRTASGGNPPSAIDPAVLFVPGAPPQALAAWSTLATADSPECRAETGGYRVTIATLRPWVRLAGDLKLEDDAPMFARVRWSAARACLEAIEVRVADSDVKVLVRGERDRGATGAAADVLAPIDAQLETWVVARFGATPAASRLAIVPGFELRQALSCSM